MCESNKIFKKYNANPKGRHINDCVVRAVAVATNKDYYVAYSELSNFAISQKEAWLFNYAESYGPYLESIGYKKHESFKVGRLKARVRNLCKDGITAIVRVKGHLTCIVDGVCVDTWDCTDYVIKSYWIMEDINNEN